MVTFIYLFILIHYGLWINPQRSECRAQLLHPDVGKRLAETPIAVMCAIVPDFFCHISTISFNLRTRFGAPWLHFLPQSLTYEEIQYASQTHKGNAQTDFKDSSQQSSSTERGVVLPRRQSKSKLVHSPGAQRHSYCISLRSL